MNLHITGLHVDVTENIRDYINKKLKRIERHSDNIIKMNITLSSEKLQHKAAAQVHLAGKDLHVEAIENDTTAAIDVLMDKLDRAIVQHKEKVNNHH